MKTFEYIKPKTLKEASTAIIASEGRADILNGGTDVVVNLSEKYIEPDLVVDIKGIPELKGVNYDEEKGLTFGALTTMTEIGDIEVVKENYAFLTDAAHTVGSMQIRNRATIVGNICNASPLADTATSLLVLDAVVNTYHAENGERSISIHEFFTGPRKTCLERGEIVVSVTIPKTKGTGVYLKNARREEVDLSAIGVAVYRNEEGDFKIALGAVGPTPIRAFKAEEILNNGTITEENILQAAKIARETATPISDIRASKDYRSEMVEVMTKRGIKQIIG